MDKEHYDKLTGDYVFYRKLDNTNPHNLAGEANNARRCFHNIGAHVDYGIQDSRNVFVYVSGIVNQNNIRISEESRNNARVFAAHIFTTGPLAVLGLKRKVKKTLESMGYTLAEEPAEIPDSDIPMEHLVPRKEKPKSYTPQNFEEDKHEHSLA